MKILHLLYESRGDYFGIGGVGARAYEIYKYLKDRHEITLLCKRYPSSPLIKNIEGLRHIFVGSGSKSLARSLLSYALKAASFVRAHGEEFDIIVEDFSPAIPTFLNFYKKRPVVLQIQGYTGKEYFRKYNPLYASILFFFEKFRPIFYRDIIVVSDATRKRFIYSNHSNIQIISNGIPNEAVHQPVAESIQDILEGDSPDFHDYILYLGRIDIYSKGLDILINAYKIVYDSFPDIHLVIAGDGRDMTKFKKMIEALPCGIRNSIKMAGWVEGMKKNNLLENALMVVIPSRHETQGIVVLESMAHGKPVITSDIPEFDYVARCGAGMSFKSHDAVSLSRTIKALLSTPERFKEMGLKGKKLVKDYTWDRIALNYEAFLERVFLHRSRQIL